MKALRILKYIMIAALIIAILAAVFTAIQAICGGAFRYENRVAYKVKSWEQKDTVEIKHIARENGKEPIYTIDTFWGSETDIPESVYLEHIGDGNNTITIRLGRFGRSLSQIFTYTIRK